MRLWEVIIIAVGLAMDAFAVSVCKGLSVRKLKIKHILAVGLYFGGFQALMPALGYFIGVQFQKYIEAFDHWVAFALLLLIGANMIREALGKDDGDAENDKNSSFSVGTMLVMAIATSIDALAVGVSFACLEMKSAEIFRAALIIGIITCGLSAVGIAVGNFFGAKYKNKAEFAGGVILILIGVKILLEHLGVISF